MKLIFLDIDGVLNNHESLRFERTRVDGCHYSFSAPHPNCIEALNFIIAATDAQIVVSSTWRGLGLKLLREIFTAWGVNGKVVGRTPDLARQHGSLWNAPERGAEIQEWLSAHAGAGSFVILDDGDDMGQLRHRLVQTDFEQGLTMSDAKRAIQMFKAVA